MRVADEPIVFEIVGIYNAPRAQLLDPHSIPLNTIFIPDNSFEGFPYEGGDIPQWFQFQSESPMLNMIVIPNGRNEEFREAINTLIPGYGNFFSIYDQGYSIVRGALDNLLRGGTLIITLCLAGWLISEIVFCLFYVMRKKKEVGLLYAMGFSRKSRFRWVFMQCLIVVILAQIIAFTTSSMLYGQILSYANNAVEADIQDALTADTEFTDADIVEDGAQRGVTLLQDPWAVPLGIGGGMLLLLLFSGGISASIVKKGIQVLRGADG
jgi:hypothetical protein